MKLRQVFALVGLMTAALIGFTTDVPPAHRAHAASGGVIIVNNCTPPSSPLPSNTQQVTYVDQNGFLCTNGAGGGAVTVAPPGCGTNSVANTLTHPFSNGGSASAFTVLSSATTAGKIAHICAINIGPVAGAVNVAMVEGTRTTNPCDTTTLAMMGGVTAATGWQFAQNGGLTYGNGVGIIAQTTVAGNAVCLFFSAGVQVEGVITYALY